MIQKRKRTLDQVYAVISRPAVKVLQPGRAGFVCNEDIGRELHHDHMVLIFGTVLSRSQRRNQGQRQQQGCHAPPVKFTGKHTHQATRYL